MRTPSSGGWATGPWGAVWAMGGITGCWARTPSSRPCFSFPDRRGERTCRRCLPRRCGSRKTLNLSEPLPAAT